MSKLSKFRAMVMAAHFFKKGYTDFRVCKKCRQACTGYEFAAMCQGASPDDCPTCKGKDTLKRPWPLPKVPRVEASSEPMMREATKEEALEFFRSQGLEN